jgi:sugar lactone lactonase YvrE
MFNSPRGIWADDTNVYVSDFLNNRLMKFNAVTGAFIGWKGFITSTAGMTCASGVPVLGQVTPDWCTGGTSGPGKSLGAFDSPSGLTGDANYIYVLDTRNNRTMSVPR